MKKFKSLVQLLMFLIITGATACSGNNRKPVKDTFANASLIEVSIGGMTCTGCEQTIQKNLGKLEGVKSVKASYTAENAIVEFFPDKVDTIKMKEAVTGSGYTVRKFNAVNH